MQLDSKKLLRSSLFSKLRELPLLILSDALARSTWPAPASATSASVSASSTTDTAAISFVPRSRPASPLNVTDVESCAGGRS